MNSSRFQNALLLNPPTGLFRRDDRCQCKVEDQTVQIIFPPIELAVLAAQLKRHGVGQVHIRDYPAMGRGLEAYLADLKELRPDMVMVNVTTTTSEKDFAALAAAKETLGAGNVITCAKGEYMEALGEEVLRQHAWIDYGFYGEIEELIGGFADGAPLENFPGLCWRRPAEGNGAAEVVKNPGHPLVENVDSLPMPARELLQNELYRSPESGNPLTVIHGNRGCPAKCIFCPAGSMSGYRVRYRSPELLMQEIEDCVKTYGIREFLFHGDTFTINKKWLIELCDRIIESGLDIRWGCNSRVDTIDDERAAKMKQAGCWVVAFGMESGNQDILDYMKKGQTIDKMKRGAEICKRAGLRLQTFWVIGTPMETEETLNQTLELAREMDPDFFDFNISYPLPGTELYEIVTNEGLWEQDPAATGYASAAVRTHALTSAQLTEWRKKALLKMYLRPRYITRMLVKAGSPRNTMNYLKAGAKRFRQLVAE